MKKSILTKITGLIAVTLFAGIIGTGCSAFKDNSSSAQKTADTKAAEAPKASAAPVNYPTKDIQLIVPFGAGGGTDKIARVIANSLEKDLGKPVVVVNKNSAGGVVGSNEIASAKPDGYTLGVFSNTDIANFVLSVKTGVEFKLDGFTYIGGLNETGDLLIVPKTSKIKSLADFVKQAKDNPGKLTVALPSKTQNLNIDLMEKGMGIDITGVVYESGNKVLADLLGGHVEAGILSASFATQAKEQGLPILGLMLENRLDTIKDVPTFKEQGFNVSNPAVRLLVAPKGLPADILAKIEAALKKGYTEGEISKTLSGMGEVPTYRNTADLAKFLNGDFKMRQEMTK